MALLGGAALRLACIGWGLPLNPDSDEEPLAHQSVKLVTTMLHPHYFTHPSLVLYLHSFLFVAYYAVGRAVGRFRDELDFVGELSVDPTIFLLITRTVALLAVIGTIIVWYVLARRLLSTRSAVFLAVLLSLCPLLIEYSVRGKTYSMALLLMSLALLFSLRHLQEGARKTLWLSAVFAGLAVSSNYATGFCAACPPLAVALRGARGRRWTEIAFDLLLIAAVGSAAFFVASPYILLDFPEFYQGFATQATYHSGPSREVPSADPPDRLPRFHFYYLRLLANDELTLPVFLASLLGLAVVGWRWWRVALLLSFVPLINLAYFSFGVFLLPRAMVFTVPFLLFFAAAALDLIAARRALPWAAMLALLVLPTIQAGNLVARYRRVDNYTLASRWINENIPAGATVLLDSGGPRLFPSDEQLEREMAHRPAGGIARARREAMKRYLSSRPWLRRFDVRRLDYGEGPGHGEAAYRVSLDDVDVLVLASGRRAALERAPSGIGEAGKQFYERVVREWRLVKVFPADVQKRLHGTVRVYVRGAARVRPGWSPS